MRADCIEAGVGGGSGYCVLLSRPCTGVHVRQGAACKPLRDLKGYISLATVVAAGSASPPLLVSGQTQAFTCPSPASDYNPNLTLARIPERTPQPRRSQLRLLGFFPVQFGSEIRSYVETDLTNLE